MFSGSSISTIMEAYRYTPLEHQDSFRLLVLLPGSFDDPIECCLVETFVSPRHSCLALSYVWGEDPERISCTVRETARRPALGQSLEDFSEAGSPRKLDITRNLFSALQHLRKEEGVKVIWADAICINQEDTAERSRQIQLMADIYRTADVVCIWLGLRDDDSDVAFQWVFDCKAKLRAGLEVSDQNLGEAARAGQAEQENESRRIGVTADQYYAMDNTFSPKASRKWWERKWTIQELVFAKKALLVCGDVAIWWDTLVQVHDALKKTIDATTFEHDGTYSYAGLGMMAFDTFDKLNTLKISRAYGFSDKKEAGHQLREILEFTQGSWCTDPRDHVYGILGLLGPRATLITPDYSKTERQVFFDVALLILTDAKVLDFLCGWFPLETLIVPDATPSWVPNLADPDRASNFRLYNSGGSLRPSPVGINIEHKGALNLGGISCGTIESFAPLFDPERQFDVDVFLEWNPESLAPDLCPRDRDVSDDFIRALLSDLDIGGFMNHSRGQERLSPERLDEYRQAYRTYVRPRSGAAWESAGSADTIVSAAVCILAVLKVACEIGVRFCRSSKGYLGWAPKRAMIGDSIYVVFGSKIPFVLRSKTGDAEPEVTDLALEPGKYFTMVGTAFFQGVMDGELLKDSDGNEVNGEAIYIH